MKRLSNYLRTVWNNLYVHRREAILKRQDLLDGCLCADKRMLTDAFLMTVGLVTVDSKDEAVPWYVPLSRIQRSWKRDAEEFGYLVGIAQR